MAIRAIIFDLGNVLQFYDEREEQRKLAKFIGIPKILLVPPYFAHLPAYQRGTLTGRQFIQRICKNLGRQVPDGAALFFGKTLREIAKPNRPMLAFVRQLHRNYKTAVLSNTVREHVQIYRRSPWTKYFDILFFSNEQHIRKPQLGAFRLIAEQLGVETRECIFTDDRPLHVWAARRAGMVAVPFRSPTQFQTFLRRYQVKW